LFAGGDDDARLVIGERNFRFDLDQRWVFLRPLHFDVNEGAEAFVLAEVAARLFAARGLEGNLLDRVKADELGAHAEIEIQTCGLARFGIGETWIRWFFGSRFASPAMISSGFQP